MGRPICRVSSLVSHHSVRDRHRSLNLRGRGTQALHLRQVGVIRVPTGKLVGLFADPAVAVAVSKKRLESLKCPHRRGAVNIFQQLARSGSFEGWPQNHSLSEAPSSIFNVAKVKSHPWHLQVSLLHLSSSETQSLVPEYTAELGKESYLWDGSSRLFLTTQATASCPWELSPLASPQTVCATTNLSPSLMMTFLLQQFSPEWINPWILDGFYTPSRVILIQRLH